MDRKHFLLDMDGVLIKGRTPIFGTNDLIARLNDCDREYVVVTNNPVFTLRNRQAGLEPIIGLSGVTAVEEISVSPYRPNHVFSSVVDIPL